MFDKAIDTYPSIIKYVSDQLKTPEMHDKAADKCPFVLDSVPD